MSHKYINKKKAGIATFILFILPEIEFQVTITERPRGLFTVKIVEIEDTKTIELYVPDGVSNGPEQAFHKIRNTIGQ